MNIRFLEFEEGVPRDSRLFQLALFILLQYTTVHPEIESARSQVEYDTDSSLGRGEKRFVNGIVRVKLSWVACHSKLYGVAGDGTDNFPVVDTFSECHVTDNSVRFKLSFRF